MNTQELLQSGGRIVRDRRTNVCVTIAYQRVGDELVYGGTVFKRRDSKDNYTNEGQRQIAIDRLSNNPVRVLAPRTQFANVGVQDRYVRQCLVNHGCEAREE
jgi:hypothetical protein